MISVQNVWILFIVVLCYVFHDYLRRELMEQDTMVIALVDGGWIFRKLADVAVRWSMYVPFESCLSSGRRLGAR